jgi:hypothetical protein
MTYTPEKIWLPQCHAEDAANQPDGHGELIKYTRTDVTDARIKELKAALVECRDEIDSYIRNEYPHDHPVQERYRQRDFESNPARIALKGDANED